MTVSRINAGTKKHLDKLATEKVRSKLLEHIEIESNREEIFRKFNVKILSREGRLKNKTLLIDGRVLFFRIFKN